MLCGLAKEKKKQKKQKTSRCINFNTWMRELSVSMCDCCSIQRCLKQTRGDHHKHQVTGRAARSLSVTRVAVGNHRSRSLVDRQWETLKHKKATNVNWNIVAKTKNRLNLQESQLKLNCESGITLYIKKEKRKQSCSISSRCFLPLF